MKDAAYVPAIKTARHSSWIANRITAGLPAGSELDCQQHHSIEALVMEEDG